MLIQGVDNVTRDTKQLYIPFTLPSISLCFMSVMCVHQLGTYSESCGNNYTYANAPRMCEVKWNQQHLSMHAVPLHLWIWTYLYTATFGNIGKLLTPERALFGLHKTYLPWRLLLARVSVLNASFSICFGYCVGAVFRQVFVGTRADVSKLPGISHARTIVSSRVGSHVLVGRLCVQIA